MAVNCVRGGGEERTTRRRIYVEIRTRNELTSKTISARKPRNGAEKEHIGKLLRIEFVRSGFVRRERWPGGIIRRPSGRM